MIPRILHQTWKTRDNFPENFAQWSSSFALTNPELERKIYDDNDNREIVKAFAPALLGLYDEFPREIFRADFVRPMYLFFQGGLYADLDFQCLQSLDPILKNPSLDLILGRMGTDINFIHSIPNAFMASSANQAFWIGYLAAIEWAWNSKKNIKSIENQPEHVTGPAILRELVSIYSRQPDQFKKMILIFIQKKKLKINPDQLKFSKLTLLPSHLLYLINWNDLLHKAFRINTMKQQKIFSLAEARILFPTSLAVTYWAHSW